MNAKQFISLLLVLFLSKVVLSQNYALNGVIVPDYYSPTETPGNLYSYLIDNNNSTQFCIDGTYNGNGIFIDLGQVRTITAVKIKSNSTVGVNVYFKVNGHGYDPTEDGDVYMGATTNSITYVGNLSTVGSEDIPDQGTSISTRYVGIGGDIQNLCISEIEIYGPVIPASYTLTSSITPAGGGSIDPSEGTFSSGQTVIVTAKPSFGYKFKQWSNAATGSSNPLTITMDADKTFVATFEASSEPWIQSGNNIFFNNTGNVGIGTMTPQETLHINGSVRGNVNGALKVSTGYGYIDVGPQNTEYAHIYSDMPKFLFNKPVWSANGAFSSYNMSNFYLQTNGSTRLIIQNSTGNVGIGTLAPGLALDVSGGIRSRLGVFQLNDGTRTGGGLYFYKTITGSGNDLSPSLFAETGYSLYFMSGGSATPKMVILNNGNVLIDKTSQTNTTYKLDVNGVVNATKFVGDGSELTGLTGISQWTTNGSNIYFNATNGNVLIGQTSQTNTNYKLDVTGKVRANEVVVNTTGADFVFEKDYKLPSLQEVENYIAQHKHLPGIAPAAEMEVEGASLGEMQTKLLQKIEELTLYTIELKKENIAQKNENTKLAKELARQQDEINELKSLLRK